mgnify:CR=1 FL=1
MISGILASFSDALSLLHWSHSYLLPSYSIVNLDVRCAVMEISTSLQTDSQPTFATPCAIISSDLMRLWLLPGSTESVQLLQKRSCRSNASTSSDVHVRRERRQTDTVDVCVRLPPSEISRSQQLPFCCSHTMSSLPTPRNPSTPEARTQAQDTQYCIAQAHHLRDRSLARSSTSPYSSLTHLLHVCLASLWC